MEGVRVGIVGATGVVGRTLLEVLEERRFPVRELRPMATERSAGRRVRFLGEELEVLEAAPERFEGLDLVFIAAGDTASRELAPEAVRRGAVVVDKSNAFRMDEEVPLVVPEVNPGALEHHRGIVASPNCSTIQLVVALAPLIREAGVERVWVSTYQAVSGTGQPAVEELEREVRGWQAGSPPERSPSSPYPHPIAFNLLPHCDRPESDGFTREEMKLLRESRKILGLPGLRLSATAVRVPVFVGHGESVVFEPSRPLEPERARALLAAAPGVRLADALEEGEYPTPLQAAGGDEVWVGRVRRDLALEGALDLWIVADNLRKGAATNAVQIAELLLESGRL
ncbi:MAG: aspartate-semialdehyde dehydrogenase [Firmicutes bacterium]|nr:aspartate-semialdehyde dehydrogenase [Bacillota bacterium]